MIHEEYLSRVLEEDEISLKSYAHCFSKSEFIFIYKLQYLELCSHSEKTNRGISFNLYILKQLSQYFDAVQEELAKTMEELNENKN